MANTNTETAVASVIDYLVADLPAVMPGDADSDQVFDGDPRVYVAQGYLAITGWRGTQAPATMGTHFPLDENFEVLGIIRAASGQESDGMQSTVRQNAIVIFNVLQDFVRDDPSLGGLAMFSYLTEQEGANGATDKGGVGTEIAWTLYVRARIN